MRERPVKALIFAGTSEGRQACDYLASFGVSVEAFVATPYGAAVFKKNPLVAVREGRLNAEEMKEIFAEELALGETVVIDATHPHAVEVSANVKKACAATGAELFRILRPYSRPFRGTMVNDAEEAARYLEDKKGAVLITAGARDLGIYASIIKDKKRLYARILPDPDVLASCIKLGLETSRIFCMQGPFSKEMNAATIKSCGASFIVTKDSGPAGGTEEKLAAAEETGAEAVIIKRPEEEGYSFEEFVKKIAERLGLEEADASKGSARRTIRRGETDAGIDENDSGCEKDSLPSAVLACDGVFRESRDIPYGRYMPVFLRTLGEKALVAGGGTVGSRRAEKLYSFGMDVTIISPTVTGRAAFLAEKGAVRWIRREAAASDVSSSYKIVACCAGNADLTRAMRAKASELGVLFNAAEEKGKCDFFFPAIAAAKDVITAVISREGSDHARSRDAAVFLRNKLREYEGKN